MGDPEARFRDAIETCGPALSRLLRGWERDVEKRAELRQDVLIAIWRALPTFRAEASLKTFVLRIAHNIAMRHIARCAADRSEPWETLDDLGAASPTEELLDRTRRRERLLQAVQALEPRDRQLTLLWLEGGTSSEVAAITGLSKTYVNTRNLRIRQALAKRLGRRE